MRVWPAAAKMPKIAPSMTASSNVRRFAAKRESDPRRRAHRAFIDELAGHRTASDASTNPILIGGVRAGDGGIMISLVTPKFGGTPSAADCQGKGVSALAQQICGLPTAGTTLGFDNVAALQTAISAFCQGRVNAAPRAPRGDAGAPGPSTLLRALGGDHLFDGAV